MFGKALEELRQCYASWDDSIHPAGTLSTSERKAREELLALCEKIVDTFGTREEELTMDYELADSKNRPNTVHPGMMNDSPRLP